jgi:hypothetical protein
VGPGPRLQTVGDPTNRVGIPAPNKPRDGHSGMAGDCRPEGCLISAHPAPENDDKLVPYIHNIGQAYFVEKQQERFPTSLKVREGAPMPMLQNATQFNPGSLKAGDGLDERSGETA